jgi:hypothetical protein
MPRKKLPPTTPGKVLLEEFLKPLEVSQYQLAKDVGVPASADQRNRPRQARRDGRHCIAAGPVLRHLRALLAEYPDPT